jgi:hypothetical protein
MDQLLKSKELPKLKQNEVDNLNTLIIEMKNTPKNVFRLNGFTGKVYQTCKEN